MPRQQPRQQLRTKSSHSATVSGASDPPAQIYRQDQWKELLKVRNRYMTPVVFDDLLAPNLPVDAMRILRHLWWQRWGEVQPNGVLPPSLVARFLPEWGVLAALCERAQGEFIRRAGIVPAARTPKANEKRRRILQRIWGDAWSNAEVALESGALAAAVSAYADRQRRSTICRELLTARCTRTELAATFGANTVHAPRSRGRGPASLRENLRWMESHRLIKLRREGAGEGETVEFGEELWYVLTRGEFTPGFRLLLDVRAQRFPTFLRRRGRGRMPFGHSIDSERVWFGPHYRAPAAMELLLEPNLPITLMPILWYVMRNTFGRREGEHSSLGYVALSNKKAARILGPARVTSPTLRGRRIQTVRETIDWAVVHRILDRKRHDDTTQLSLGPEVWFAFRTGHLSTDLRELVGADAARVQSPRMSHREEQQALLFEAVGDDTFPMSELIRVMEWQHASGMWDEV